MNHFLIFAGKKLSTNVNLQVCLYKKFAPPGSRPVIALASAPGSGNTWTRHLLESASGIYTGSIYNDKKLYRAGELILSFQVL